MHGVGCPGRAGEPGLGRRKRQPIGPRAGRGARRHLKRRRPRRPLGEREGRRAQPGRPARRHCRLKGKDRGAAAGAIVLHGHGVRHGRPRRALLLCRSDRHGRRQPDAGGAGDGDADGRIRSVHPRGRDAHLARRILEGRPDGKSGIGPRAGGRRHVEEIDAVGAAVEVVDQDSVHHVRVGGDVAVESDRPTVLDVQPVSERRLDPERLRVGPGRLERHRSCSCRSRRRR